MCISAHLHLDHRSTTDPYSGGVHQDDPYHLSRLLHQVQRAFTALTDQVRQPDPGSRDDQVVHEDQQAQPRVKALRVGSSARETNRQTGEDHPVRQCRGTPRGVEEDRLTILKAGDAREQDHTRWNGLSHGLPEEW